MQAAVERAAAGADAVVMAAAVADFRPAQPASRSSSARDASPPSIQLERQPGSARRARRGARSRGGRPVLVGFAAETHDVIDLRAREAREPRAATWWSPTTSPSRAAGFAVDTNHVALVDAGGDRRVPRHQVGGRAPHPRPGSARRCSASASRCAVRRGPQQLAENAPAGVTQPTRALSGDRSTLLAEERRGRRCRRRAGPACRAPC